MWLARSYRAAIEPNIWRTAVESCAFCSSELNVRCSLTIRSFASRRVGWGIRSVVANAQRGQLKRGDWRTARRASRADWGRNRDAWGSPASYWTRRYHSILGKWWKQSGPEIPNRRSTNSSDPFFDRVFLYERTTEIFISSTFNKQETGQYPWWA